MKPFKIRIEHAAIGVDSPHHVMGHVAKCNMAVALMDFLVSEGFACLNLQASVNGSGEKVYTLDFSTEKIPLPQPEISKLYQA